VGNQQRPNQQQGQQAGSSSQGQYPGNSNQGRYPGNNNNFPRGNQYGLPWRPPPNYYYPPPPNYYQQPYNNYYQYPPQNNPQQQQNRPQSTDETLNQFMQMSMANQKKGNTQGFLNSSRSYKLTFHFRKPWSKCRLMPNS